MSAPYTTHFTQPLDRAFFKPLKTAFNQACGTWIRNHPGRGIRKLQFGALLAEAWGRAATIPTAVHGFQACGLYPINKHSIPDAALAPSKLSDRGTPEQSNSNISANDAATTSASTPMKENDVSMKNTSNSSVITPFEDVSPTYPELKGALQGENPSTEWF